MDLGFTPGDHRSVDPDQAVTVVHWGAHCVSSRREANCSRGRVIFKPAATAAGLYTISRPLKNGSAFHKPVPDRAHPVYIRLGGRSVLQHGLAALQGQAMDFPA